MPPQHFAFHLCPSCQASYNMDFDIHPLQALTPRATCPCCAALPKKEKQRQCGNARVWFCLEDMLDLNSNRTGGCAARHESPDSPALSIIGSRPASPQWEIWRLMVRPVTTRHQSSPKKEATLPPCGTLFHDRRGLLKGDYATTPVPSLMMHYFTFISA